MPLQFAVKLPLLASLLLSASAALFRDGSSWLSRSRLNASADIAVGATLRRIAEAVRVGRDPVEAGRWWARDGVSGPPTKYNTASKVVKGMVNVHIVPHSHDDVGWLKTVDQYSEGSHNGIQHTNVNLEIDTVLTSLLANPDRKFIFVEQAFFQRWVEQQPDEVLAQMRSVVESGQLEFINGGWSMHDESSPTYLDMVDQTTLGHRLISEQFGRDAVPKTTWQIDVRNALLATTSAFPRRLTLFSPIFAAFRPLRHAGPTQLAALGLQRRLRGPHRLPGPHRARARAVARDGVACKRVARLERTDAVRSYGWVRYAHG